MKPAAKFIAPPPPAIRGLISGVLVAGILSAFFLFTAPPAHAQVGLTAQNTTTVNVLEGGTAQVPILITGLTAPITILYRFRLVQDFPSLMAEHAAATLTGPGADMSDPGNGRVIIRPGDVVGGFQATFPITIADDSTPEPTEEFIVAITGYESTETVIATGLNTGPRIVIAASDQPAGRTLTVTGPASITETDSNAESSNYTIALTGMAFSSATTVTWTVSHGTTVDADFVAATDRSGTVSFAASDTSRTFTLTIAGDDLNEAAETFSVQVSVADATADGGTAYGSPATTTITDDDTLTATLSGGGD